MSSLGAAITAIFCVVCVAATPATQINSTQIYGSGYNSYNMDNVRQCSQTYYLMTESEDAYVNAWTTYPHSPLKGGCAMTFSGYSAYGLKMKFVGGSSKNKIWVSGVTLKIYAGSGTYGELLVSVLKLNCVLS